MRERQDAEGRVTDVQPEDTLLLDDYDWHHYWYDAEGRTTFTTDRVDVGAATPNQEAHYYDGEGRLVLLERHHGWSVDTLYSDANEPEALSEWYRYDALGRRVLVFTHHEKMRSCNAEGCESMLTRYVWAGDQLLYETRGPAADSIVSSWLETDTPGGDGEYGLPKAYGTVGYTHAGGIDRPLGVLRIDNGSLTTAFYPHLNWRGLYETATTDTGTEFQSRDFIKWPGAVASAYLGANTKPDSAFWWYGSQITESADASGLLYRRNRYYDPASGRFTQPDPAGIGGGLNGYGFAAGDPVSNADPFGLSPDTTVQDDTVRAALNECVQQSAYCASELHQLAEDHTVHVYFSSGRQSNDAPAQTSAPLPLEGGVIEFGIGIDPTRFGYASDQESDRLGYYLPVNATTILSHEMGHVFGGLDKERGKGPGCSENCAIVFFEDVARAQMGLPPRLPYQTDSKP